MLTSRCGNRTTVYLLSPRSRTFSRRPVLGDIDTEQCLHISCPLIAPSPPIRLIFCTLSFYSPRPGILCPGTCGYFMDLPEYYKRKRIWLFMTPTNSSCQSTLTHLILVPPSHWLVSFHVTMSLSTQLSVDSQATLHDEDIEMNSEDCVLSQMANKILNEVNNTKGEER